MNDGPTDLSERPWQRAQEVAHAAAALGFDWPDLAGTLDKTREELLEVAAAAKELAEAGAGPTQAAKRHALVGECGDVLFSALNVCRLAGVDPQAAIAQTTATFTRRFAIMRQLGLPSGQADCLAQWQQLWQQAKQIDRDVREGPPAGTLTPLGADASHEHGGGPKRRAAKD